MVDRPTHYRAYDSAGGVITEMAMPADGPANFQADRTVACVVFYTGPVDAAVVVGRLEMAFPPQGNVWVTWEEAAS